jgi:phosphopantothenoylcysteine decarboxylase/phosphopantothenate--cysteine ligase
VRFIGNRSSGKQGYAVARVAAQRGADVTLIAGNTIGLVDPAGVEVVHIGSASQLQDAVSKHAPGANVLVMAAAVADFRPTHVATSKIKKSADSTADAPIELSRTDDVLAGTVRARTDGQLPNMRAIVGFAAETGDANGDVLFHARAKLRRKGCDLLVVNAVGDGRAFEVDNNDGWLLAADGNEAALEHGSKTLMASRIVDAIAAFLRSRDE